MVPRQGGLKTTLVDQEDTIELRCRDNVSKELCIASGVGRAKGGLPIITITKDNVQHYLESNHFTYNIQNLRPGIIFCICMLQYLVINTEPISFPRGRSQSQGIK